MKRQFKSGQQNFFKGQDRTWNAESFTPASEPENPFIAISSNRRTIPSMNKRGASLIRQVHPDIYRFYCPYFSPDGASIGMIQYLTVGTKISVKLTDVKIRRMKRVIVNALCMESSFCTTKKNDVAIFYNYKYIGVADSNFVKKVLDSLVLKYPMLGIVIDEGLAYHFKWGIPGYLYTRYWYEPNKSYNITQTNYIYRNLASIKEFCTDDRITLAAVYNKYYQHNDGARLMLGMAVQKHCATSGKTINGDCFVGNSEKKILLTADEKSYGVSTNS
jgi:hypothetical protein